MDLFSTILKKKLSVPDLSDLVIQSPEIIPHLFHGLDDHRATIKFTCEKILRFISEKKPELMYPYFQDFVELMDSENSFLKWGAILTLANLVQVDTENQFEKIFKLYFAMITSKSMITASNVIKGSWKIALARPQWSDKIVKNILKSEEVDYENKGQVSPECKNIVFGHAIESFNKYFEIIKNKKTVINFVKRQCTNTRKPVADKAKKFLHKYHIE